jgi:hypothetical protein
MARRLPAQKTHYLIISCNAEKASQQAQDEFREEAANLLKAILEKNDDFGDRRVR